MMTGGRVTRLRNVYERITLENRMRDVARICNYQAGRGTEYGNAEDCGRGER
jgi:hypothetical protein